MLGRGNGMIREQVLDLADHPDAGADQSHARRQQAGDDEDEGVARAGADADDQGTIRCMKRVPGPHSMTAVTYIDEEAVTPAAPGATRQAYARAPLSGGASRSL